MDKVKQILVVSIETILITSIVLFSILPFSCKVSTQGIQIIGGNYKVPQLLDMKVIDEKNIRIEFSDYVKLENLIISPFIPELSDSYDISNTDSLSPSLECASGAYGYLDCSVDYSEDNKIANIYIEEETEIGSKYEIYGVVTDKTGNSLTFCLPFVGFNSRIPKLKFTEIHPAMAGIQKTEDANGTRRLEYVEIYAESAGNLAGLEFCSGYAGEGKAYVFPAVEVGEGEIFLVHLRTWGEGCISEESENLTAAWSRYCGNYRDLWSPATTKPMGDKSDVLVIRDISSGKLIDAVMYSDGTVSDWGNYLKTDFTLDENFCDFYEDSSVEAAWSSAGIGTTKVLARNMENGGWSITAPSPGSL